MDETTAQNIIEGLQSLNADARASSAKELNKLCLILGKERTSKELIEFLYDLNEDDSVVLLNMSNHLTFLVNFLPDVNECYSLFDFILTFLINYENRINANGYKALKCYLKRCNCNMLTNVICPKIFHLAKSESDNYKIGVSRIIPAIIKKCVYENQIKHSRIFIHLFLDLCQDECILVKKACCGQFCKFLKTLKLYNVNAANKTKLRNKKKIKIDRVKNGVGAEKREEKEKPKRNDQDADFDNELEDEEEDKLFREKMWSKSKEIYISFFYPINCLDELQTSAIRILSDILATDPNYILDIKTFLTNLCKDESWRVRAVLAVNIHKILKNMQNVENNTLSIEKGKGNDSSDLSVIVLLLLKDVDSNVRSTVFENLDKIFLSSKIQTNIIEEIFEDLKRDIDSNNVHLKISLCKLLCTLPDFLDKNNSIEYVLPLFLLFIRIEETELKSDLFVCLHKISKHISFTDMKQIIIPLSSEIMKNKNWRMRYSLYYYLKHFDHFFFITNKENEVIFNCTIFWDLIQKGAKDSVYTVRNVTIETTEFLLQERAFFYFEKGLTALLNELKDSSSYLLRITCLQYISKLVKYFPLKYINTEIVTIIDILSKDNINNVRLNVLKAIYYISSYIQFVSSVIKKDQYEELIRTVTPLLQCADEQNPKNKQAYETNKNTNYFQNFEKKNRFLSENKIPISKNSLLASPFIINASSLSSISFYDNLKNTEANKTNSELILAYLTNLIHSLCNDIDEEIAKIAFSLKQNLTHNMKQDANVDLRKDEFFGYLNSTISFGELCRPIK